MTKFRISLNMYIFVRSACTVAYGYILNEFGRILLSVALTVSGTCRIRLIEGKSLNIVKDVICVVVLRKYFLRCGIVSLTRYVSYLLWSHINLVDWYCQGFWSYGKGANMAIGCSLEGTPKIFFVDRFTVVSNGSCCCTFVVFCIDFGFKNLPRIGTLQNYWSLHWGILPHMKHVLVFLLVASVSIEWRMACVLTDVQGNWMFSSFVQNESR